MGSCKNASNEIVVYFVRHAEKDLTDTTDNPMLTPEGRIRAESLVNVMNGIEVDEIYSTRYDRNMNTVQPLANDRNLAIINYDWYTYQPMLDEIKQNQGKTFFICGHGDTILPMIEYLGGKKPQHELGKHEYDKMFVVRILPSGEVLVETKVY